MIQVKLYIYPIATTYLSGSLGDYEANYKLR